MFSWGQIIEGFACCAKEGIFKIPSRSRELNKDVRGKSVMIRVYIKKYTWHIMEKGSNVKITRSREINKVLLYS